MADTSKKTRPHPPAAQRKLRKPNKVNPHASQNDESVLGIGAFEGGWRALQEFFSALPGNNTETMIEVPYPQPEMQR